MPVNPKKLCWQFILCACGCNQIILNYDRWGDKRYYKKGHLFNVKNPYKGKFGDKNPQWKGGRHINNYGYVMIYSPNHRRAVNGYVREHILIMEKHLNACVLSYTHIHHINGIKTDNRIENLELMSNSKHQRLHKLGVKYPKKTEACFLCGDSYRDIWRKIDNEWHCVICAHRILRQRKKIELSFVSKL